MDSRVEQFLDQIAYPNELRQEFNGAFIKDIQLTNARASLLVKMNLPSVLSYKAYKELYSILEAFKKQESGFYIDITFTYASKGITYESLKALLEDYLDDNQCYDLSSFRLDLNNKKLVFEYSWLMNSDDIKAKTDALQEFLAKINTPLDIELGLIGPEDISDVQTNEVNSRYEEEAMFQAQVSHLEKMEIKRQQEIDKTYIPCKIKDAANGKLKRVEVTGKIFDLEVKEVKNKTKLLLIISYTDNSYSISSNLFESKKFDRAFLTSIKIDQRIKIKGRPEYDEYAKQETIRIDDLEILPPEPLREDTYSGQKRIELHLHTKMSVMDGVASSEDYYKTASRWGWEAIGVTDHGAVSAFPQFQDLHNKYKDTRPLYGVELYMCDDVLHTIANPSQKKLKDMTYVVFDLETSGLSCRYDRIIEFGAVKYENGQIIDRADFFINPDRKLSPITTNLTHITQEQVDSGLPIKVALKRIVEFIGDSCLVAHNGQFDFGFVNEALKNNSMPILDNPLIDTLPLSRYMYPEIKSHSLGGCCRRVGVEYNEDEAHRAIYDAEVLLSLWEVMENSLINTNSSISHQDLASFKSDTIVQSTPHPNHVCVYAKNKKGLRDLFFLVSESNIKYLNNVPRVPKSLLDEYRQDLIIGSACFNGEVFETAMTKSKQKAQEIMQFYDYIEVQPPCEYDYLVNDGQLSNMDDVYKILKDIISMAREIGKKVVATSDAHYIEKDDKIYRDVFVFAKGLKGSRHQLNPYRRDKMPYYDNPDQHLRTTQEMLDEFKFLGDENLIKEIVIDNTHWVADQISNDIHPIHSDLSYPTIDNCDKLLRDMVYSHAKELYGDPLPAIVEDRLNAEMEGISSHHYEVIYWIASKLVIQANERGYIVGSRGSVGSSLVATMSGITEVNPLPPHYRCPHCKHLEWDVPPEYKNGFDLPDKKCPVCGEEMVHDGQDIPFATFIGFKADKTPDIDLNFPRDYQAQAHESTKTLLYKESGNQVFKAGTIQSVEEKNAYGYAKGYFEYLQSHPELHTPVDIPEAEIKRLSKGLIGTKRTTSQHPGGIIVIPRGYEVYDFTPIQYPADKIDSDWQTSHFDYNQMHDTILKLDLLGHVDPMTLKLMGKLSGHTEDFLDFMKSIPFNDKEVMSLFTSVEALHLKENYFQAKIGTLALPEFGTDYVQNLIFETKPKTFADLLRVQGLSHGTNVYAGNQQDLIKSGQIDINNVIGCRDDIMLQLHQNWGMDLEESFKIMEIVRHGRFLKPKPKEGSREMYIADMKACGVPQYYIDACDKIQYLFPKAHAAAYTMMALRVAWFKIHDPLSFYAAYFTCRCDQFDIKVMSQGPRAIVNRVESIQRLAEQEHKKISATDADLILVLKVACELWDRGYKIEKISIEKSLANQWTIDRNNKSVIPPFTSLSGVGESAGQTVVDARNEHPFTSIDDLRTRTKLSQQKIEELKQLGALGDLPDTDQITLF